MIVNHQTARIIMWVLLPFGIYMLLTVARQYYIIATQFRSTITAFRVAQERKDLGGMERLLAQQKAIKERTHDPVWIITDIRAYMKRGATAP